MSLSFEVLPSANAGVTQLVECDLAKVDVAGSNPVSRSNFKRVRSAQHRPRSGHREGVIQSLTVLTLCNYRYSYTLGNGRRRALVSRRPT